MRLDHIAYRVKNRHKTAQFFIDCLGYKLANELPEGFKIEFEDGSTTDCLVLVPTEDKVENAPWEYLTSFPPTMEIQRYHMAPEIFVSDGPEGSIVGDWVRARGGIGGIHHLAYQVDSVEETMKEWKEKGYAEFMSEQPLTCPGLVQVFTKPSDLTGVIYELITREENGFCKENVKDLMNSTKTLS